MVCNGNLNEMLNDGLQINGKRPINTSYLQVCDIAECDFVTGLDQKTYKRARDYTIQEGCKMKVRKKFKIGRPLGNESGFSGVQSSQVQMSDLVRSAEVTPQPRREQ